MIETSIRLTDEEQAYLQERVHRGGFDTPGDYFRALLREDRQAHADEQLEQSLLKTLDSPSIRVTDAYWEKKRAKLEQAIAGMNYP